MMKKTDKRFCPYCGAEVTDGGVFCLACGSQLPVVRELPSPRKRISRNTLFASLIAAGAAILIAVIVLLTNTGPDVLKEYRDKDIWGVYEGIASVSGIDLDIDGDPAEIGMGKNAEKEMNALKSEELPCRITVEKNAIRIELDEELFLFSNSYKLDGASFKRGYANGTIQDSDGSVRLEYALKLHESDDPDYVYRITGTVEVSFDYEYLGVGMDYDCEFDVDVYTGAAE